MKYLVTGGLGVVGSRFVEIVAQGGHQVTIIDSAEEPRNLWMRDYLLKKFDSRVIVMQDRVEDTDFGPLLRIHDAVFMLLLTQESHIAKRILMMTGLAML